MDVAQLLNAFGFAPDIEVVITREPERPTLRLAQLPSYVLLEHLQRDRKFRPLRLGYEQVNVFGHDHISRDVDSVPLAYIFQSLFKDVARAGSAQASFAVAATESDEVQAARLLKSLETPRHTGSSYARLEDTGSGRGNNTVNFSGNRKKNRRSKFPPSRKERGKDGAPGSIYTAGAPSLSPRPLRRQGGDFDVRPAPDHSIPNSFASAFHLLSTRDFVLASITISSGQGRVKPSVGHLRVASMPILEP